MNELIKTNNQTMSSKRIAERTGKRHDNVVRDINKMILELRELDSSNLRDNEYQIVKDSRGYDSEILLNERLCLCLAAGYSVVLRMAIIDDWAEMKANATPIELSRKDLALMVIRQEEEKEVLAMQVEAQQKLIDHQQPKVDAHDMFMESGNVLSMEEAGKSLSIGRNTLIRTLQHNGLLSKTNKLPYQQYINAGLFRVKQVTTGIGVVPQVFITPKGLTYITNKVINKK